MKLSPSYPIIPYHQSVPILSHHNIPSSCPYHIISYHNKLSSSYIIPFCQAVPHPITSYHIIKLTHPITYPISPSYPNPIKLFNHTNLSPSVTLSSHKLSSSYHTLTIYQALPILSHDIIKLSSSYHTMNLWYLINQFLSYHTFAK